MDVAIEAVEEWGGELRVIHNRLRRYFVRSEARDRAIRYMQGLLSEVKRKNGWQLAEEAGESTPDGMQRLLSSAVWDADDVRDELYEYVMESLADDEGVLVVDECNAVEILDTGMRRDIKKTCGGEDEPQTTTVYRAIQI